MKGASVTGGITNTIIQVSFTPLPIRHRTLIHRQTIILALLHPIEHQMQVILTMILRILNELGGVRKVERMNGPRNVLPQHSEHLQAVTIPPDLQIATTIPLHTVVSPCLIDHQANMMPMQLDTILAINPHIAVRLLCPLASVGDRPTSRARVLRVHMIEHEEKTAEQMRPENTNKNRKTPIPEVKTDAQDRTLGTRAWCQKRRIDEMPGRLIEMAIVIRESRHPDKLTD